MPKVIKSEDVLQGIPVVWVGYSPPGGKGWRKTYTEEIAPLLADSRAKAEKTKRAITERECIVAKVKSLASEIVAKNTELQTVISSLLEDKCVATLDLAIQTTEIKAVATGILKKADSLSLLTKDLPNTSDIDEDIKFFDAFTTYIDEDAELDRLLYALFSVDVKYRPKLLRAAYRMLVVVEETRGILRNSKSVVFNALKERLAPIFETLDKSYSTVAPALRKFKKEYAKVGISALATVDYTLVPTKKG